MIKLLKKLWPTKAKEAPKRNPAQEEIFHYKGTMIISPPHYEVRFGEVFKVYTVMMKEMDPEVVLEQLLDKLEQEKGILNWLKQQNVQFAKFIQERKILALEQMIREQYAQCPQIDLAKLLPQNIKTND